jgi:hypothetical protein
MPDPAPLDHLFALAMFIGVFIVAAFLLFMLSGIVASLFLIH